MYFHNRKLCSYIKSINGPAHLELCASSSGRCIPLLYGETGDGQQISLRSSNKRSIPVGLLYVLFSAVSFEVIAICMVLIHSLTLVVEETSLQAVLSCLLLVIAITSSSSSFSPPEGVLSLHAPLNVMIYMNCAAVGVILHS